MSSVDIASTLKSTPPRLHYEALLRAILPRDYELSIVFIGDKRSHTLNKEYRKKDRPTNILSFPLEKNLGEIYLNLPLAKREAKKLKLPEKKYLTYLFIHGMLHLKGHSHGSTMDRAEKRLCAAFRLPYPLL